MCRSVRWGDGEVRLGNVGQGNGGTSLPCKKVWLITDGTDVRVNIGAAASAVLGLPVTFFSSTVTTTPMELEIDDVAKLYFYGTNAKVIDILYRR